MAPPAGRCPFGHDSVQAGAAQSNGDAFSPVPSGRALHRHQPPPQQPKKEEDECPMATACPLGHGAGPPPPSFAPFAAASHGGSGGVSKCPVDHQALYARSASEHSPSPQPSSLPSEEKCPVTGRAAATAAPIPSESGCPYQAAAKREGGSAFPPNAADSGSCPMAPACPLGHGAGPPMPSRTRQGTAMHGAAEGPRLVSQEIKKKGVAAAMVGGSSAVTTAMLLQPLDVVRTRLQQPGQVERSAVRVAAGIYQNEGVRAFWKAAAPTFCRVAPGAALYFSLLQTFQSVPPPRFAVQGRDMGGKEGRQAPYPVWYNTACSATARACTAFILSPTTVLKTRMEMSAVPISGLGTAPPAANLGMIALARDIFRKEGVCAFWRGVIPTLVRDVPFSSIYFPAYQLIKHWAAEVHVPSLIPSTLSLFSQRTSTLQAPPGSAASLQQQGCPRRSQQETPANQGRAVKNFLCGTVAGAFAATVTQPPDVIRTRLQLAGVVGDGGAVAGSSSASAVAAPSRKCMTIRHAAATIWRESGFTGFFRGIGPRVLKRTIAAALTWTLFDEISARLREREKEKAK